MAELLIALSGITLLAGVFFAGRLIGSMTERLADQSRHIAQLEQQIANHHPEPRVHTHSTVAGIEDAQAVGLDLVLKIQTLETELAAARARAEQQLSILGIVRQSPSSYDSNRPAGNRPQGWNS